MSRPIVNIAELPLDRWSKGALFAGADVRIGPMIGVKDLGISYSEVPPGKSACPFHNHHVEDEIFIILEGEGTYRFGPESHPIKAGDVLGAPAGGQDTAHQIINTGSGPLRYYGISTGPGPVSTTGTGSRAREGRHQRRRRATQRLVSWHPVCGRDRRDRDRARAQGARGDAACRAAGQAGVSLPQSPRHP
jgi:uncharacterized cupin superfamily protein